MNTITSETETLSEAFFKASRGGEWLLSSFEARQGHIGKFGFAVLSRYAVNAIKAYSPLLEVGAGSGYWARELSFSEVDIIATDPGTGQYFFTGRLLSWKPWIEIEKIAGVEAVQKYPERTLLTVWPDMESWPAETLEAYTGKTIVYCGESNGDCTADEKFFQILEERFTNIKEIVIPQFCGVHDYVSVWERT